MVCIIWLPLYIFEGNSQNIQTYLKALQSDSDSSIEFLESKI